MTTTTTTVAVNSLPISFSRTLDNSNQSKEQMYSVPVKFADDLFSTVVKDQINALINLPEIQELQSTDESATETLTYQITEMLKRIIRRHIKDNYKVVIQVMTYSKSEEGNILIMSRCLWNYRTDDVLSLEIESDTLKFLIVIHGVVA